MKCSHWNCIRKYSAFFGSIQIYQDSIFSIFVVEKFWVNTIIVALCYLKLWKKKNESNSCKQFRNDSSSWRKQSKTAEIKFGRMSEKIKIKCLHIWISNHILNEFKQFYCK